MKRTVESLDYIMDVVNDLYDASEGSTFPHLSEEQLTDVTGTVSVYKQQIVDAPMTALILNQMLSSMTDRDLQTNKLAAADPDRIAQAALDALPDEADDVFSNQEFNALYDAIHSLASLLIKDVGQYR